MNVQEATFGYPSASEVDEWVDEIWREAHVDRVDGQAVPDDGLPWSPGSNYARHEFEFIRLTGHDGMSFYAYWQPAWSGPAPLLVHLPGYGGEISTHPDLVLQGYNVLHVNPLGYATPSGFDVSRQSNGVWPVLADTILTRARHGYRDWLVQAVHAVRWAQDQPTVDPRRVSFFGTSQGGGGALLLASIFRDHGVRCVAADLPFLTAFKLARGRGAYALAQEAIGRAGDERAASRALGFVDTLSHSRRLTMPVLLTGGMRDDVTPLETIELLFDNLPAVRSLSVLDAEHRYTREFAHLSSSWFRLFS